MAVGSEIIYSRVVPSTTMTFKFLLRFSDGTKTILDDGGANVNI
jgi:hypothetical protein